MDAQSRKLERRAAAGDVEAEVQLLLERVRAGELTEDSLMIAGHLGHPAAVKALDLDPHYRSWIPFVDRSEQAQLRVVLCLAEQVREVHEKGRTTVGCGTLFERSTRALTDWILEGPSKARTHVLASLLPQLQSRGSQSLPAREEGARAQSALEVLRCGVELVLDRRGALPDDYEIDFEEHAWGDAADLTVKHVWTDVAQRALIPDLAEQRDPETESNLLNAIQAELVPWALGRGDSVRERTRARE